MATLSCDLHPLSPRTLIPQCAYDTHVSLTNSGSTELLGVVPIAYQRSSNQLLKDLVGILKH